MFNEPLLAGAIKKVMPVLQPQIHAKGVVKVRICFNTNGEVEEAETLTGHPLLRSSVIVAVRQWRFKPSIIDGPPIKIHGVLAFKFSQRDNGESVVVAEASPIPSNLRPIWTKLHPSISAIMERMLAKAGPNANESAFVQDGYARLLVRLKEKNEATTSQLKKLSFEIAQSSQSSELVSGRLPIGKLEALASLAAVRYVSPLSGK